MRASMGLLFCLVLAAAAPDQVLADAAPNCQAPVAATAAEDPDGPDVQETDTYQLLGHFGPPKILPPGCDGPGRGTFSCWHGVEAASVELLERAAMAGSPEAAGELSGASPGAAAGLFWTTIAVENGDQPSMMGYGSALDLGDHSYNPNPVYRQRIKFWLQRAIEMGGTGIPPNGGKKTYAAYAQDNLSWLEERERERSHRFHDPTGEEVIPGWPQVDPVETLRREARRGRGRRRHGPEDRAGLSLLRTGRRSGT